MGLITCQGCQEIIGDSQSACPHCETPLPGYVKESEGPQPKLVSCEDCGREVSRRAATCPHCGAPTGIKEPLVQTMLGKPRKQAQQGTNQPGTVLVPLAVYAGVMLLVLVGLPPILLVLAAAAAGAMCAWPVGKARVARSLLTYAGLHITLRLWVEAIMSSGNYVGPGSGASAEEIERTIREIAALGMSPPGNWYEVEWQFGLAFLATTVLVGALGSSTPTPRVPSQETFP